VLHANIIKKRNNGMKKIILFALTALMMVGCGLSVEDDTKNVPTSIM